MSSAAIFTSRLAQLASKRLVLRGSGRRAAVLVPICHVQERGSEPHLLFTKRSSDLRAHSGQVSFPGGRSDAGETAVQTALRETCEEIGIRAGDVEVCGELDDIISINGEIVTPVVGFLTRPLALHAFEPVVDFRNRFRPLQLSEREVSDVMYIPISQLADPKLVEFEDLGWRARNVPIFRAGKHPIWGLTDWRWIERPETNLVAVNKKETMSNRSNPDLPPSLLSMTAAFDDDEVEISKQLPKLTFDEAPRNDDDDDDDGDFDAEHATKEKAKASAAARDDDDSDTSTHSDDSNASDDTAARPQKSPSPRPGASGVQEAHVGDSHKQLLAIAGNARRPRGDTKIIAVSEAEADNVFLSHLESDDDESEMAAAAPGSKSADGFHQKPLVQNSAVATPAKTLSIKIATSNCLRCKTLPHTIKMSLKVGTPIEHFQLMNFCTLCALAVQSDKVEAAKMAKGDVAKAIAERASQAPLRKQCERCKKRQAHTIANWEKKKNKEQRMLTCGVCITEHKDFKQLVQYALSCVVNLDFNAARQSFLECLQMSPNNAQVFFNLACVESLTRNAELGLKLLRAALENGYSNWKQVTTDEDLARVRALPDFPALVAEFKGPKVKSPRGK
jgi:8-oxo-dGTP pyrophosphatase MutT (NUDIX family)